jgi:hypothetical protein
MKLDVNTVQSVDYWHIANMVCVCVCVCVHVLMCLRVCSHLTLYTASHKTATKHQVVYSLAYFEWKMLFNVGQNHNCCVVIVEEKGENLIVQIKLN